MTPEQIQNIFTPFSQVNHRGEILGNGVGLSICKMICEQLDGTINIESTPGQGTLVMFSMKCNYYESNKNVSLKQISEQSNESSIHAPHSNSGVLKRGVNGTSTSSFDIEENEPIYESAKELNIKIVKSLS